jgi:Est1 DNA/RNA binding domain
MTGAPGRPREFDEEFSRPPATGKRLFEQDNDAPFTAHVLANTNTRQRASTLQHQRNRKPQPQSSGQPNVQRPRSGGGLEIPMSVVNNAAPVLHDTAIEGLEASGLVRQPETRPISQEQLVAEVKGIYAGLVMVEGKCIQVDLKQAALARDAPPGSPPKLNNEQWQALIALHRTLLHEHHDFFLASQHPSATPAVKRLATKYAMPARLWRHGIHSFLELLRNRLPESLDHMLAFIYLAYSMMTLLFETVPAFEETWIECLGDLGRYRMAIEDDNIRDREVWTQVARQWYLKASDRSPRTGRLYHHLAILARPNALQQLFFYGKALSVAFPFVAAKDSMGPFFQPFLDSKQGRRFPPVITAYVNVHAYLAIRTTQGSFTSTLVEFVNHLDGHIGRVTQRFLEQGYYIAIANCIALLAYGSSESILMRSLTGPKASAEANIGGSVSQTADLVFAEAQQLFKQTAEIVLQRVGDPNILSFLHVLLVFLVHTGRCTDAMSLLEKDFPFQSLATMLNTLLKFYYTYSRIEGDEMPIPEKNDFRPTPEEFAMRGLPWADLYFSPGWFSNKNIEDENQYKEDASMNTDYRPERILWLGCQLAKSGGWISYNTNEHRFFVSGSTPAASPEQEPDSEAESATVMADCDAEELLSYASRTSTWASEKSRGEESTWDSTAPVRTFTWDSQQTGKEDHMETEESMLL